LGVDGGLGDWGSFFRNNEHNSADENHRYMDAPSSDVQAHQ
jgi:hypothetical protein